MRFIKESMHRSLKQTSAEDDHRIKSPWIGKQLGEGLDVNDFDQLRWSDPPERRRPGLDRFAI